MSECQDCGQGMLVAPAGGRCEECRERAWREFQRECAREWHTKRNRASWR